MTDWDKATGNGGTMKIRDTGTRVEFYLRAGSSATFNHNLGWGYTVNGTTDNTNTFDFESGGTYQLIHSWAVTSSQTVTFRLQDSGTSGLGGPTNHSAIINRDTEPDPPTTPAASSITSTSLIITFSDGSNGGDAIDARQIGYGTDPATKTHIISSDGSTTITGLSPGETYYFWARTHNSEGYSAWSARRTVTMLNVPGIPGIVQILTADITQVSVKATYPDNGDGGSPILERQIGYSLVSTGNPTDTFPYSGPLTLVTGLLPGRTYYFRARSRNAAGWSLWSAGTAVTTHAGALVKVGAVWVKAVPYVRVAGVWKVAQPWSRKVGFWNETSS
jgi:hypothetical protein